MSGSTCVNCGASGVILDHDGRCSGCPLPAQVIRPVDEQRARLQAQRDAETDPVLREAYAMAKRAGFDWYDTESSARRAFEHAAGELLAERKKFRDAANEREREFAREVREAVSEAEWEARERSERNGY